VLKFFVAGRDLLRHGHLRGAAALHQERVGLAHYTDWIVGHVHEGALGWNGFMAAGMFYWLVPRLYGTKLHSKKRRGRALLDRHHRHPALRRLDVGRRHHPGPHVARGHANGALQYPNFVETLIAHSPDVLGPPGRRHDLPRRLLPHGLEPLDDRALGQGRDGEARS
jgi:cytochrome c oxidase cbb3-type subunit I/II